MSKHYFIMGKNTLSEVLKREGITRIIEVHTHHDKKHPFVQKLLSEGVNMVFVSRAKMEQKLNSTSHGGFAALMKEKEPLNLQAKLEELEAQEKALIVVLDGIVDPHNVGAILRSCECFGVDLVIWSKNRGPSMTPTVSKVSVGGSELVPTCLVSNLHDALLKCQDHHFSILTAEKKAGSVTPGEVPSLDRKVLVMGSEEKGVRPLLSKMADYATFIPMKGQIDSLNVSAAAAVLLSWLSR